MKQSQYPSQLQPIRVQITDFVNEEGTVFYNILVINQNTNNQLKIKARYSQLSELNENIQKFLKKYKSLKVQVPSFPAKKWWVVQDDSFINHRKSQLQQYFQDLLQQEDSLSIDPLNDFLGYIDAGYKKSHHSLEEKLEHLRQNHNKRSSNYGNSSNSSNTIKAHYEQSEYQDKQSQDNEISFPFSFCEISLGATRNQQINLGSFTEEIHSIKRKSIDQSDFDNSSIMFLFPSPPNNIRGSLPNYRQSTEREESLLRSQIETHKNNNNTSNYHNQNKDSELDQSGSSSYQSVVQQAMNCINRNKTVQPNVYICNLEEYKATQRKFKREVEQIIESSEMSSGIEQNIFCDSDEEEFLDESGQQRKQESDKKKQTEQQQQLQSNSRSQCKCYNSESDSDTYSDSDDEDDESYCNQSKQQHKSYTKSVLKNSIKHTVPIMQRSTDDDCGQKRRYKPKSHQSSGKKVNHKTENILKYLNSSQSLRMDQSANLGDDEEEQDAQQHTVNDSTKTIYKNDEGDDIEDKLQQQEQSHNNSQILKDLSYNSQSHKQPIVCINKNINDNKSFHLQFIQNLIELNQ